MEIPVKTLGTIDLGWLAGVNRYRVSRDRAKLEATRENVVPDFSQHFNFLTAIGLT